MGKAGGMISGRGAGGGGEDDFARRRMMAILGASMMGSPSPLAIGEGLRAGTLGAIDARKEWQERQRQIAQDRLSEEYRQSQIAENQAQAERYREQHELGLSQAAAKRAEAELALRSKGALLEMLRAESPEEAAFYESDVGASAEDIRRRLLELRKAKSKAEDEADDPVPSRTVFDQFQEYRDGKWVTVANRPDKGGGDDGEETLTPYQVEQLINRHMDPRSGNEAATREEALSRINPSVLPKSYRAQEVGEPAPEPARGGGTGAGGAPPKKTSSVGASATVTFAGRKVAIGELVDAVRDEGSPQAAFRGLVERGVPPESAKMIVGLAFPGSL